MKYEQLSALQKLEFWCSLYDIEIYTKGNVTSIYVKKKEVTLNDAHYYDTLINSIELMLSELEKTNPKAVRDYDKKQVQSRVLVIPGVVVPNTNIDFSELPEWANWITVCKRGKVRAHSMEPKASMNFEWLSDHRSKRILEIEPRADWQTLKFKITREKPN